MKWVPPIKIVLRLLVVAVLLQPAASYAQNLRQWMQLGADALDDGDFLQAALYYGEAFHLDSTSFEATIRFADALRLSRDYAQAARLYDKAYVKDKGRLFPEGQYYLAQMQMLLGEYSEALRNFTKYEKRLKKDKSSLEYRRLKQSMAGCSLALAARMPDASITVEPLTGAVNTEKSEFAPYLNDSTLYFSASDAHIKQHLAPMTSDGYGASTVMNGPWDSSLDHGNLVFSPDGDRVYFTECSDERCSIFEADVQNGALVNMRSIPTINQGEVTSTMPHIGVHKGREILFFASDRKGTRGGLDIWWSYRQPNGSWDAPVNAGDNVNTPGNEISPFFSGTHLYFSSDWHPGFGGYDVFRSKGYPRSFDVAENLDRPINSSLNDLYFKFFPEHKRGLMASNREGSVRDGSFCCNDLYTVVIADSLVEPDLEPDVFTSLKQLNDYLPVTLYFHNDEPDQRTRATTTSKRYDETFTSYMNLAEKYRAEMGKGLKSEAREDSDFEVDEFFTFYVEKGMRNLANFAELLLEELQKGYSIQLSIKGFASPRAKSDYNVNLTSRRINSLTNYLHHSLNGAFLPYIEARAANHATLTFEEIPFGEYRADQSVSDELDDRQASVYSRGARMERKIEILSVQRGAPDSLFSAAEFSTRLIDFGQRRNDALIMASLDVRSSGTDTLVIDSLTAPCGCTVADLEFRRLAPGKVTSLHLEFNPEGLSGLITRKVYVFVANREEPYELTIAGELEP